MTALTPSDKESLANASSPVSGKSSAWLPSADSKRQLLKVPERPRVQQARASGVGGVGVGFSTSLLDYYLGSISLGAKVKRLRLKASAAARSLPAPNHYHNLEWKILYECLRHHMLFL